jgi:predicted dehydrogenase
LHSPAASSSLSVLKQLPLDIAVVGLRFGRSILNQTRQIPASSSFNLSAVCDFHEDLVWEAAREFGVPGYRSLDELLKRDSSPVIGLFTAPKGRAQLIRKIIRAGRDVLTTKPFELDADEAQSVLEEARDLGRIVHLNSPSPTLAEDLQLIKDWRGEHHLGEPIGGSARVWVSYQEDADQTWLDDPVACPAAPLFRLGIYLLNDFTSVFGPAESIQLMTSSIRTRRPTPDNAQVNIKYRNGALGHVFASFCVEDGDHYQNSMVLNFENGTIYRNAGGLRKVKDIGNTELILVQLKNGHRTVTEQSEITEPSGRYQWAILAESVRSRILASDELISDIVQGIRLVNALQRAQDTDVAQV